MGPWLVLSIRIKDNLGVIAMNGYSIFSDAPKQEIHHQMQISVMHWTLVGRMDLTHRPILMPLGEWYMVVYKKITALNWKIVG